MNKLSCCGTSCWYVLAVRLQTTIISVTPALTVQFKLTMWTMSGPFRIKDRRQKKNSWNRSWQLLLASSCLPAITVRAWLTHCAAAGAFMLAYLSSAGTNVKGLPADGSGSVLVLVLVLPWSTASLLSHLAVFRCLYHRLSLRSGPERGVTSLGPLKPLLGENYRQAHNNHTHCFRHTHRTKHISTNS